MVWGFEGEGKTTVPLHSELQDLNLKDYFAAHSELQAKYRNNPYAYINQICTKFSKPVGFKRYNDTDSLTPLENHEWPVEFRTLLPKEKSGRLKSFLDFGGGGDMLVVDQALKDVIERVEPGIHQFRPVRVTTFAGEDFPGGFHTLLIGQFIDSFSPEQSDEGYFAPAMDPVNNQRVYKVGGRGCSSHLALSRAVIGGAHLWRETRLRRPTVFMSDELHDAIKAAGLKIPIFFKMKVGT